MGSHTRIRGIVMAKQIRIKRKPKKKPREE